MQKTAPVILGACAVVLIGNLFAASPVLAQGTAPSHEVCSDKAHPPTDPAVQGGCIAVDRKKGNCQACHLINGIAHGNIAPPLTAAYLKTKYPDKAKLRAQVWDATVANPHSVMPPFGRNGILSEDEIDKVVDFLLTL
jgi:sulfur-oxidizing protein SoxX